MAKSKGLSVEVYRGDKKILDIDADGKCIHFVSEKEIKESAKFTTEKYINPTVSEIYSRYI